MPCYYPIHGYRSRVRGPSGKRPIVFSVSQGFADMPEVIPCGQCSGCRLERSRQWAIRCMHEASLHTANCFLTLTYSEAFLPSGGSLDKRAFQLFMKRLRKRFPDERIRYYHCGEYGATYGRPHYHVLLFGFDFGDKYLWSERKGFPVWRSPTLEELWPFGRSEIGSVTFESAAYVARYIMKKVTGELAEEAYKSLDVDTGELIRILPEYTTMSRRPGIGSDWFAKYRSEVYPADSVIVNGQEVKPPRFYDDRYELVDGPGALEVKRARRMARRLEEETPERLRVREQCTLARLSRYERSLD